VCEISGRPIARDCDKFGQAVVIGFTIDRWSMMLLPSKKVGLSKIKLPPTQSQANEK